MAFESSLADRPPHKRPKVAIIGGGVSGLGAAWKLSDTCDVTLFEAEARLGGHARTVMAGPDRDIAVDTGFMVFNERTYPNLIELFAELEVDSIPAPMSFAVSIDDGRFEYGLTNLSRMFADRRNLLNPRFFKLLSDIVTFNRIAPQRALGPEVTLGEFIKELGLGSDFSDRYLFPLAGAIWSTARDDMHAFPARTFVQFFDNHGLLSAHGGPKWRTPKGGSRVYVERLERLLSNRGATLRTGAPIQAVGRDPHPWIKVESGSAESFDHVVMACHSDQSLALLDDPTKDEIAVLGAVGYRPNQAFLHSDTSHMPKRRAAWSSWVYRGLSDTAETAGSFTYWMNSLQSLPSDTPLFVTLNPQQEIPDHLVYDAVSFTHPQFDRAAIAAQSRLHEIQGRSNTWFCGAWTRYGFHEDGLQSGLKAAEGLLNAIQPEAADHA